MLNIDNLSKRGPGVILDPGIVRGISSEVVDSFGGKITDQYFILGTEVPDTGSARLWLVRKAAVGLTPENNRIEGSVVRMNNGWELFVPRVLPS